MKTFLTLKGDCFSKLNLTANKKLYSIKIQQPPYANIYSSNIKGLHKYSKKHNDVPVYSSNTCSYCTLRGDMLQKQ